MINNLKHNINLVLGGSLLVAGTCIGGGMIGLPVKTAAIGFYPTIGIFALVWAVMTLSALFMLEASLYIKGDTNLISMADKTLGKFGKNFAWFIYIAFLYSVMASYTSGGSTLLASMLGIDITNNINLIKMAVTFVGSFGLLVYLGAKAVDYCNRILMLGLFVAYISLVVFVKGDANILAANSFGNPKYILYTLPLMVTSFGYHLLIPTLKYYLKENIAALRLTIIVGGLIPLIIYCFWEREVFQLLPIWGDDGLVAILTSNANPAELIINKSINQSSNIKLFIGGFSFFALVSSFVGVGLGIMDFLADGFKVRKTNVSKIFLAACTFIPPAVFTIFVPGGFLVALGYAGIFASLLLIIYPAIMAWSGRYKHNLSRPYEVIGGKFFLLVVLIVGIIIIAAGVLEQFKLLPIPSL